MGVFYATKNKKENKNEYNEYKATNKRSYDMSSVYLAESDSKKAIDIINEYDEKVKSNAYLSSEDLATYRSAVDSYTNSVNVVNDYAKWAGQPQSNTNWDDIIKGLNTNYDALEKYYSRWENEDAYKEALEQQKIEEGYLTYDSVAGQAEIDRLQEIVDEYAKIPTPVYSNTDRGGTAQAKLDAYNSAIAPIAEKYGISYEEAKKQLSEKSAYHTLAVRAQTLNEYETIEDPLFEQYVDIGKDIAPETPHVWRRANRKEDNPVEAVRRDYAQEAEQYGKDIADYKDTASVKYDQQVLAMTEEEVNNYNYILAKDGKKAADEYFSLIEERLNARIAGEVYEEVYKDKPLLEYAFGVVAGLDQFASGVKGIFSDEYTPISKAQYVSSMIRDDLADNGAKLPDWLGGSSLGQVGYDFVTTGANMLPSILAGIVVEAALPTVGEGALVIGATTAKNIGKGVGAAVLGASAGGNAKAEMLRLGYSLEQANSYGAMVGVSEAGLEYLIGSIPGISKGDGIFSTIGTKAATKVDNAISRVAIKLGNKGTSILKAAANGAIKMTGGALDEAFEEGLQTVLETWFKEVATNVDFDDPRADEILYSSLLGAIMSYALGGGRTIATEVNTISQGKIIQKVDGGVERLKSAGSLFSDDTVAKEIADKVNENTDAYTIGKLFYEVGATLSEQNISDIENGLRELGMSANDAKKIAREYAQHLNAWTSLTDEGKAIFSSLDPLAKVLRNKIIGENTNVYQRTAEYKDLMALADEVANPKEATSERTPKESTEPTMNVFDQQALMGEVQKVASDMSRETNRSIRSAIENKMAETENVALNNVKNTLGVKGVYTSNDTGATRLKNNKQRVNIVGVDSVGKNGMMLKLSDGSVVDAKDISFSTSDEALVYEAVANMGMSANTAWEIIKGFDSKGNQKGAIYAMGALEAYTYGHNGVKVEGMSKNGFSSLLSETQKNTANKYGDIDARAKVDAKQSKIDAEYNKVRNEAKSKGKAIPKRKGDTILEFNETERLTELQQTQLDVLKSVAKGMGVTFHIFKSSVDDMGKRSYTTADGKTTSANGWYDPKTGEIWIDLYAGNDGQGTMIFTAAHELTHFIAQWSPAKFKVFADFLLEQYGKKGQDVNELIRTQIAKAKANHRTISWDEAFEEVVADSCETFLRDSKAAEKISALHERDASLANKIKSFIGQLLAKIRKFMADPQFAPDTKEGKMVAEMTDSLQKLYDLWTDALADAGRKYSVLADVGIGFDSDTQSVYSLRYSPGRKDSEGNVIDLVTVGKKEYNTESIAKLVSDATGRSIEDARKWVNSEIAIANIVMNNPEFLDFEADDRYESIKKNSDYPQGTVDLSNLCPKREEFTAMFDMLQKKYPNRLFTASDVAAMREILKEQGVTVACGACFVEDRRQLLGEIADTYIGMWKEAVETGKPLQKTNASGNKITLKVTAALAKQYGLTKGADILATDTYIPTQYDLTTYEGFKLLEKNHPIIAMGFNRYNNSRGQQAGRLIEGRAEYNRQVLGWSDAKIRSVNNNGGLRIFSFSDFEVVHLLDLVQVIIDCSAKGVKIQGYTKIPAFARLVRNTGIKLNRSLIPNGQTGIKVVNGKQVLDIDLVEGINTNDENFLDESDNPNVGNIIIGINPTQIGIAMLDDFIDYIIPFHTNKSKDICKKLGVGEWVNYKESQHDKDIDTGKASKHNVNIYTQVINKYHPTNKVEFVNAFLKECKAQKKIPRYSEFLNKEYKADGTYHDEYGAYDYTYREGYHKFLVDFKMFDKEGNILPQGNITPELDNEFMAELLKAEVDKKANYEFPQEVYDRLDEEFGENSVKYSDRDSSYMDAVNRGDMETAQRMVDEAAREAGYPVKAFHGTNKFGFTEADVSKSDDGISFFAVDSEETASTYSGGQKVKRIVDASKGMADEDVETIKEDITDLSTDLADYCCRTLGIRGWVDYDYFNTKLEECFDELEKGGSSADAIEDFTEFCDELFYSFLDNYYYGNYENNPWLDDDEKITYDAFEQSEEADKLADEFYAYVNQITSQFKTLDLSSRAGIYELYANTENHLVIEGNGRMWDKLVADNLPDIKSPEYEKYGYRGHRYDWTTRSVAAYAKDLGYSGVTFKDIIDSGDGSYIKPATVYIFFNPQEQVKSADPVTYDDNGNIIPLSGRFNAENDDIRYSDRTDIVDVNGKEYDHVIELEYRVFNKVRKRGSAYINFIRNNLINKKITVYNSNGGSEIIEFAKSNERVRKDGSKNFKRVLGELEQARNEIKKLVILNADETARISWLAQHKTENSHQWLDANGWDMRISYVMSNKGIIYPVELHIAKTKDGRNILYDVNVKINEGISIDKIATSLRSKKNAKQAVKVPKPSNKALYHKKPPLSSKNKKSNPHSDRSPDAVSDRVRLANALESAATNSIERQKLKEYKNTISSIGEEQAKLSDIRAKIRELNSAEGKKDTKAITALRFEEKQAENRINTYDRQLLRLESMKPIKDVVTREKQMAQERAVEKERELRKDALARQRARSAETTRRLLNRQKEQRKEQRERAIERRDETTLRRKLRKTIKELNSLLKNGTKKRNIKEEMKDTVATSLALAEVLFNDDIKNEDIVRLGVESVTVQESEYLNKYRDLLDERDSLRAKIESIYASGIVREKMLAEVGEVEAEIKKLDGRIAYLNNKLSDLFERERARLNRSTIDSIINELAIEYAKLKTSEYDYIKNAYNDAMKTRIEALAEALKGTVVKDMDVNQLSELYDMFKAIEHMIRHSNSLFREGRTEDLMTYVSNVQGELYEASTEQKDRNVVADKIASIYNEFSWNNLRPVDAVERLGSETFEKLFWDFVHAMGVAATDITEAGEVIASAREKFGYSKWNMELADTPFTTRDGMTFKPSLADKLSIYAYSKREGVDGNKQAMGHMTEGGFVYDTGNTYKETEKGKTYVRRKLSNTYRLSEENIQATIDSLTDEQKGYVDAILPYLTDMGKKGNEVSMTLYGIELFGEKVYFPLQSSRDYLSSTTQTLGATPTMASLANSGFTKATKPHASNPIVLRGFDDVVLEHIEKMSNYHALVIPIENLRRVFDNVGRETEGMPISTKALIGSRFGAEAQKYFEQWLTDINGGVMPSGAKNILGKLFSRAKGMSVAANLSVVAQQYFSIIRAMEVVDPKYFAPFLNSEAKKTDMKQYEELLKYAPIAIIKEMGGFDVGSSGRAKDYIGYEGARKDAKYINKKIDDLSMWGAGAMDKLGWVTIWKAVKAEVASEHNLTPGTDKFYEACKIRFTEVVTKTQVFDSVASRSGYMRSQHDAVKYATSFMGEPTAIMGRYFVAGVNLVRAIKSGNKARIKSAWGRMGRAATVIAVSGVLGNLAKSLVYAGRDDEDDEALLERWMRNFAEALRDDLNILNSLPFGRDIVSVIEGWDVERPDMTIIADMVTSAKKMLDGDITLDDSLNLVGSVGNLLGKPLKNVIREIKSAINVIGDITDDVRPTDMGGAFVEGITGDERTKMETLYDAIVRGDKSKEEVIKATYKNDTEYTSAVRKALRENDPRVIEAVMAFYEQNHTKRQNLTVEIEKEGNFTPAIVRGAINNEIQYLKNKINDAKEAKKNGDTEEYKKIVKALREKYPKDFVEKVLG